MNKMSHPREPDNVKFIASVFSPEKHILEDVVSNLQQIYGLVDHISQELFFDRTKYYAKEMGWPLFRRFISFKQLLRPDYLVEIKLNSNEIERRYMRDGKRLVNIDPGYISAERLVLATGKNYVHRIYLAKGIYADLTLVFKKGGFRPLEWTYPDYKDPLIIGFFNNVRTEYMNQLREAKQIA